MKLTDYTTLSRLKPIEAARGWSESDVPLQRRGVALDWLIAFINDLQSESQLSRISAMEEAKRAESHNKAGLWGLHDQPDLPVPQIPRPSLMNIHCFVEQFVKPLTEEIRSPLYARIPDEYVGPPDIFISHAWNALLVGPEQQRIGMIDAFEKGAFNPKAKYIWIDFICYNQHLFETIAPDMERVIGEIGKIGFVATPVPLLNRSWCLWELLCSERTGASTDVFVRSGYRNDKILSVNTFFRSFTGVQSSQSSSNRDQTAIFEGFLKQFGSFESADAQIEDILREKLSSPWFELHERDVDLQFRPYPWFYDKGTDNAGRDVGIEDWKTFDPYYSPALRESILLGSNMLVFDMLIGAGMRVSGADKSKYELEDAETNIAEVFQNVASGDTVVLKKMLSTGFDITARINEMDILTIAAGAGNLEAVRILLDSGANPDSDANIAPLRIAADKGHLDVVRLLIENGATIDAPAPDGWTALLWAASSGHTEIVIFLEEHGADADIVAGEKMATPLHMASAKGHEKIVAFLLTKGVVVSPRAFNGATPLHYAVQNKHIEVVRLLLDHGADINAVTNKGVTLKTLAMSSRMPEDILRRLM